MQANSRAPLLSGHASDGQKASQCPRGPVNRYVSIQAHRTHFLGPLARLKSLKYSLYSIDGILLTIY
jgi:hypothetical protein